MEQSPELLLDEWEIPRENIVLNRKLGEGAFGAVCGGEVIGLRGEGEWVPVAVKSLKIGSLPEDKVKWLILPANSDQLLRSQTLCYNITFLRR